MLCAFGCVIELCVLPEGCCGGGADIPAAPAFCGGDCTVAAGIDA
jgi:hypothetical protein